jgi:hypothetical protein
MDLTDSFTWEDLPTRHADTGHLTAAGWIPLTMKYSRRAANATVCLHIIQTTLRIVTNHETQYNVWYPFDWTVSPFYELVNISQVTISKTESALSILVKGKGVPEKARCGPEGSRRFRLPYFMTLGMLMWCGCQPHALAAFTHRNIYSCSILNLTDCVKRSFFSSISVPLRYFSTMLFDYKDLVIWPV